MGRNQGAIRMNRGAWWELKTEYIKHAKPSWRRQKVKYGKRILARRRNEKAKRINS